jgi:curved DNA-binding protein CbpA
MGEKKSLYSILGVDRDATDKEICLAYCRLARKAHPDVPGGSESKLKALTWARDCLLDPLARANYDQALALQDLGDSYDGANEPRPQHPPTHEQRA